MLLLEQADATARRRSATPVQNILYATDFSATSDLALPYAAAICRRFGGTLHVAHIVSDTGLLLMTGAVDYVNFGTLYQDAHNGAKKRLESLAERLGALPHSTYLRHGKVWPNLQDIVVENAIDLIVLGSHGRTGVEKMLLGSVAEDVSRHAVCPVLTVGPKVCGHSRMAEVESSRCAPPELELRHILYAASTAPESLLVAPVAIGLAEEFRSRLTLMHVFEKYVDGNSCPGPIEDIAGQLHNLVPDEVEIAYAPEVVVKFGIPWETIVSKAAELNADLIVLGAHPKSYTAHAPWSTVHQVMAHAPCPVLTVRNQFS